MRSPYIITDWVYWGNQAQRIYAILKELKSDFWFRIIFFSFVFFFLTVYWNDHLLYPAVFFNTYQGKSGGILYILTIHCCFESKHKWMEPLATPVLLHSYGPGNYSELYWMWNKDGAGGAGLLLYPSTPFLNVGF